jgi:DNA invertase Pin-like site-specific DNA recombinase
VTTRAAIYLRISRDFTGEQLAVDRQRRDCLKIVKGRGWQLAGEYVDNSISASDRRKDRPGYNALVDAFESGEFDALVCYDLDRLSRQPRQLEDWIDAAEHRGLLLATVDTDTDLTTDNGRLFARVKLAVARSEVERKSARQRSAAHQRVELGKPPLGVRLLGYTSHGELVPAEAATVRDMFARFEAGESLRGISEALTASGASPRHGGPRWNPSTVRGVLTNGRYCGRSTLRTKVKNGGRVEDVTLTGAGHWTPLIDEATFGLVADRLADPRRRTQHGTDRKHLGSGLYVCGVCGSTMRAFSGGRYRCPRACVNRSGVQVDAYVLAVIRARLGRPDLAELLAVDDGTAAAGRAAEIKRLRARLVKIESDYDAELIDGRRFKTASDKVKAELATVESAQRRDRAAGAHDGILRAPDPVAAFDASSLMIKRSILDALVTVSLLPAPRGRKTFDPDTVGIEWRDVASGDGHHHGVPGQNWVRVSG